jgi:hypothetical protein
VRERELKRENVCVCVCFRTGKILSVCVLFRKRNSVYMLLLTRVCI